MSEVLDALGLTDEFHLIGFSMGGFIAAESVKRNVFPVDRLVLISPAGTIPVEPRNLRLLRKRALWTVFKPLAFSALWLCSQFVNQKKMAQFYSDGASSEESIDWKKISRRNLKTTLICARDLPLWKNNAVFEAMGKKARPILICWG
eukprot:Gregarina_sp_Poly_1__6855@NODE_3710_length_916_cov_57_732627_g51_i3_p1_GENE_NODE_3710_length_916_cov_57_732627_g51_i3NODE_3710_length_916_cov_57_732627_g51_i3_p1_ORF_typecomplete_len147_score22_68Hydrolase_4/PF12146_8/9_2e10Abhydrolase_1/PF00561_20/2_8e08Abhydrolase_6/PF12697_7/4_1e07DUF1057/PF06342_12/5_7e06UPF0227/PF05728_12/0_0011Ndr/PF03096_14/0_00082Thioesterase/PF00975_20/0_0027Palm_thioest/PF02089_15/0_0083Abhydrolase_8/PF06259_12/0_013Ser_hydrolase/PF06821_13/0_015Chlorophyllase2/PF12740